MKNKEKCIDDGHEYRLRPATEQDLKDISGMTRYYDTDLYDEESNKIGVDHMFCNDIKLEGKKRFKVKSLCVFHNGRIMTVDEVQA